MFVERIISYSSYKKLYNFSFSLQWYSASTQEEFEFEAN